MNALKFILGHWKSQFLSIDDGKSLEQLLSEAQEYYNLKVPSKVDDYTYMDSCVFDNNKLVFNCTLFTVEKGEFEGEIDTFRDHLKSSLATQASRTKRLQRIINKEGILEYNYKDKNDEHITTIAL